MHVSDPVQFHPQQLFNEVFLFYSEFTLDNILLLSFMLQTVVGPVLFLFLYILLGVHIDIDRMFSVRLSTCNYRTRLYQTTFVFILTHRCSALLDCIQLINARMWQ